MTRNRRDPSRFIILPRAAGDRVAARSFTSRSRKAAWLQLLAVHLFGLGLIFWPASRALFAAGEPHAGAEAPAPAAKDPGDIRTEQGLREALDLFESRYEAACVKMNEASWRAALATPGQDPAPAEQARKDLASVYFDPKLDELLKYWSQRNTVTQDRSLSRRVVLWYNTRESAGVDLDPAIFALTRSLAARLREHRYQLDGRQVTLAELERIIATNPDRESRRKAWLSKATFAAQVEPEVRNLVRQRALKARGSSLFYFHHLAYRGRGIDAYWAKTMMDQIAAQTKSRYLGLQESMKSELGLKSAGADAPLERFEPWDIEFAMARRTSQRGLDKAIAAAFPPGGALPAAAKLLEALGFDPGKLPIHVESSELGAGGAMGLGVRIPSDIRIVADGAATTGGPRYYEAVFREYGRALQSAFNKQSSPMLKGYECVDGTRNELYAEGIAEAMAGFVHDPIFLEKYLGMDRKSIALFLEDESDRTILRLRELLLNMGIEFAIYVNPDANLDERYRVLLTRSLGVAADPEIPVLWPIRLSFVTSPAADLDRIIALSIAPEVQARLAEAFGDARFGSGKSAPWLIEHCFADGELVETQMRLSDSIRGGLDFEKYLNSLGARRQ
ncbi:MAG TPA: hypothetical protein VFE84_01965 [Patescibacteria group bacterium]|nr:hypothetical protein [Patescibacteria group bacterium]